MSDAARTLAHVLVRLDDRSHTGTLRLTRDGHPEVHVKVSEGRVIGVTELDGSPLRRHFRTMIAASGLVTFARLARLERRARRKNVTVEWQLVDSGISADTLRRLTTADVREWLIDLMDTGGFVGRLEHGLPIADPWQEPLAISWLTKIWRERRAERERLGLAFPPARAVFRRTNKAPTDLFAQRGATQNPNSPYADRKDCCSRSLHVRTGHGFLSV